MKVSFIRKLKYFSEYYKIHGKPPSGNTNEPTIYKTMNLTSWWTRIKFKFKKGEITEEEKEVFEKEIGRPMEKVVEEKFNPKLPSPNPPVLECENPKCSIYINRSGDAWTVIVKSEKGSRYAGRFNDFKKARKLQEECYEKVKNDCFDEWIAEKKKKIKGVTRSGSGKWEAKFYFEGKNYHLGTFENVEDAKRLHQEAKAHTKDFFEWLEKIKKEKEEKRTEKTVFTMRMSLPIKNAAKEKAAAEGRTLSNYIENLIVKDTKKQS